MLKKFENCILKIDRVFLENTVLTPIRQGEKSNIVYCLDSNLKNNNTPKMPK